MEFSFRDYQAASTRTMPKMIEGQYEFYYDNTAIMNYCMGLCGETGEFVDLIKKALFHGHPLDDEKAKKELGDVLHYLAGLCTMLGYSLEQVATLNIDKLNQRYPKGFSEKDSRARVDEVKGKDMETIRDLLDKLTPESREKVLRQWGVK